MRLFLHEEYHNCDEWTLFRWRGVWRVLIIRQKKGWGFDLFKPHVGVDESTLYFSSPRWLISIG
jgi:hypothetical protein